MIILYDDFFDVPCFLNFIEFVHVLVVFFISMGNCIVIYLVIHVAPGLSICAMYHVGIHRNDFIFLNARNAIYKVFVHIDVVVSNEHVVGYSWLVFIHSILDDDMYRRVNIFAFFPDNSIVMNVFGNLVACFDIRVRSWVNYVKYRIAGLVLITVVTIFHIEKVVAGLYNVFEDIAVLWCDVDPEASFPSNGGILLISILFYSIDVPVVIYLIRRHDFP